MKMQCNISFTNYTPKCAETAVNSSVRATELAGAEGSEPPPPRARGRYNVAGKIGGDSGLTDKGKAYAKELAEFVRENITHNEEGEDVRADEAFRCDPGNVLSITILSWVCFRCKGLIDWRSRS